MPRVNAVEKHEDDDEENHRDALRSLCPQQLTGESRVWRVRMFRMHCFNGNRCRFRLLKGNVQQLVDRLVPTVPVLPKNFCKAFIFNY